jgi:hypothetical protein
MSLQEHVAGLQVLRRDSQMVTLGDDIRPSKDVGEQR